MKSTWMLLVLLVLAACQPGSDSAIASISIEAPKTLNSGAKARITATVSGKGNFAKEVIWTVEGQGTLADSKANPTDFTAPNVTSEVLVRVKATAATDPSKSASAEIKIVPAAALNPVVNPEVTPPQPSIPDPAGNPQPVAASRDNQGIQSEFVAGQVLIRPKDQNDLNSFLQRYEGSVLGDNTIPEPPAELNLTLSPDQRKASEYLVKINLAKVDLAGFAADAAQMGFGGQLDFSSDEGLRTLAATTDALAAGFDVSPNYLDYSTQFPTPLFSTQERSNGAGGFTDAFATTRFQSSGSQSNVSLAWQFVAAHGIQRRVRVAIIDDGFWLNTNGTPRGTDSDFPANPIQYDFQGNDYFSDGPGTTGCGASNPCFWHGTGSAGVATGIINNLSGAAGTGGLVADPILLKSNGQRRIINWAIRTAVAWGADVVSMSFGGDCNQACRIYDRDHTPFDDAFNAGSRTVFIAAAGNGDSSGNGYDVGSPRFFHPCIEDHVICVGALNDNATTRIGYSNFGGRVDIFAPTNIPVMSQPAGNDNNPNGPAAPRTFGGTSASTPFVAGVAAMVKAINPNLNTEDVRNILNQTAHAGSGQVTRRIDAYAAVRKAAEGIEGTKDRYEPNGVTIPSVLAGAGPWNNLGLHSAADRDYYRFSSTGRTTVQINVQHPETLGQIPWLGLQGGDGACGVVTQTANAALPNGTGRSFSYTIGSGPHLLSLGGGLLNAYNLSISYASAPALPLDSYEVNDQPAQARYLYSIKSSGTGLFKGIALDPGVTISANLHSSVDVDYYQVRGVVPTLAQTVLLKGGPIIEVHGNESAMKLEVYNINPDNTPGSLVQSVSSPTCTGGGLQVAVEADKYYLVKVSGSAGRYTLFNGVRVDPRKLPAIVRDRVYQILHPGDPIEHRIRTPVIYILTGDKAFSGLKVKGAVHLNLFDVAGNLLAEGTPGTQGFDEALSLTSIQREAIYALEVTPKEVGEEGTLMSMAWEENTPSQSSPNLISNPGGEDGPFSDTGSAVEYIQDWGQPSDFVGKPTVTYYNGVNGFPSQDTPGPEDRGNKFFAGGPGQALSAIRQNVQIAIDWHSRIDGGGVKFNLSAFLGGFDTQGDNVNLIVTFLGPNFQELGKAKLGPVSPEEREGKTGMFRVATSDYVPVSTRFMYVDLEFKRNAGDYNDGYADNLELSLQEFAQ